MASSQYMTTAKCSPFTGIWKEPDMSQCNNTDWITQRLKDIVISIDTANFDNISEEMLNISKKSIYFKEVDVDLAVGIHEKMVSLIPKVSANNTLRSINNLINIPEEVLAGAEQENRNCCILYKKSQKKIPLEEQQVTAAIYSNLGIGVAKVKNDTFDGLFYGVSYGTNETEPKTWIYDSPNPDQQEADAKIMASISLPRSLLKHLKDEERPSVSRITFFSMRDDKLYRVTQNSSAKGNTEINSHIISASIPNISISNLDEPIKISFNLINQNANKPQCVYWDESSGLDPHWSLNGCNVSNFIPGKEVTCSCDRLKSFAVLMDVYQKEGEKENANYLSIVSNAGFGISFVCLVLTIIIHVCFRNPWDLMSSKILVSLCSSLAVTYFIFLVGMQTMAGCKVVAGFLHYFLLTSLAWMSVEAFHVFLSVVVVFKTWETSFMKKSSILAWGLPAVIVTITLAINNTDNYTKIAEVCWLSEPSFYVAFLTPVVIILIFNFILISLVTWRLISPQRNKRFDRKRSIVRVLGLVGLLFLFGLTWVFAFFAVSEAATVFRYLFLVCNTLQGIFIFVFYCLYKKDTRDGVKEFVIKRKRANPWKFTTGKSSRCGNETEYIAAETNF
ncbi:adhesion G-protein coupled receptor G6-like [Octopus sinensis]|uniref:Adhesion G-protein coupled receptor G6-like n=1 Tax=Octopus sinensis TaxID=2607531 RepID=A0A6P7TVA2_9MOLL|nr:adhesion G-protein coupled receptor G6-like [Octopus sinensis]